MARIKRFTQRKRNQENRKRNPFVVIGCEGKNKTEKIYFKNFNNRNCMIKFSKGNCTDPVGIVQDLIKYVDYEIDRVENDKVYAVFDTDIGQKKQKQIEDAKSLANANGVEIITSTPTFEIWFLLHFGYTTKSFLSSQDLINELKKHIESYEKNIDTYPLIKNDTKKAITNAKKLEKWQIAKGQVMNSETCNPYTAIYKVVEELMKRNNK